MGNTPRLNLPFPEHDDAPDGAAQIRDLAIALDGGTPGAQGILIVGEIRWLFLISAPHGWLPCDGAAVSRVTFAALFSAIGERAGAGDGQNTFNVPDLRGRVAVGAGEGTGLTMRAVGTRWGVEAVALTMAQTPEHNHYGATPDHLHGSNFYTGGHSHAVGGNTGLALGSITGANQSSASGAFTASNHWHDVGGWTDAAGNLGVYGSTGGADRGLAFWTANRNLVANAAAHENAPPSVAIPAYIYAGV